LIRIVFRKKVTVCVISYNEIESFIVAKNLVREMASRE
jgi:hypothetical protein